MAYNTKSCLKESYLQFVRKVPKVLSDRSGTLYIYHTSTRVLPLFLSFSLPYYHLLIAFYNEANFLFEVLVFLRHGTVNRRCFRLFKNHLMDVKYG